MPDLWLRVRVWAGEGSEHLSHVRESKRAPQAKGHLIAPVAHSWRSYSKIHATSLCLTWMTCLVACGFGEGAEASDRDSI